MFFLPASGSVLLSAAALFVATTIAPSILLVAFMGLRLVFLALFTAMFYCER